MEVILTRLVLLSIFIGAVTSQGGPADMLPFPEEQTTATVLSDVDPLDIPPDSTTTESVSSGITQSDFTTQETDGVTSTTLTSSDSVVSQTQTAATDSDLLQKTSAVKPVTDSILITESAVDKTTTAGIDATEAITTAKSDYISVATEITTRMQSNITGSIIQTTDTGTTEPSAMKVVSTTDIADLYITTVSPLHDMGSTVTGTTHGETTSSVKSTDSFGTSAASPDNNTPIAIEDLSTTEPMLIPEPGLERDLISLPEDQTSIKTITETSTRSDKSISSDTMSSFETTTISYPITAAHGVTGLEITELTTSDGNVITEGVSEQISTTESFNVTTDTEIAQKSARKKSPSFAIDPSIALGIDISLFEDATDVTQDNTTTLETTTELAYVTGSATPALGTTTSEDMTTTRQTPTTESVVIISVPKTEPPAPEHPPPIIVPSGGRQPDVQMFPGLEPVIARPKLTVTTTQAPPPPIIIPEIPRMEQIRPKFSFQARTRQTVSTAAPVFEYKTPSTFIKPASDHDPRFMSVSELAQLALQQQSLAHKPGANTGLQMFFKPIAPITRHPTTTDSTVTSTSATKPTDFVHKFKLPADSSLTKSIPWLHTEEIGHKLTVPDGTNIWGTRDLLGRLLQPLTTTEPPQHKEQPFQLPFRSSLTKPISRLRTEDMGHKFAVADAENTWGTRDLWGRSQHQSGTTELPTFKKQPFQLPFQSSLSTNLLSKTEQFQSPFKPSPSVDLISKSKPLQPSKKQLFAMPENEVSSNIWGSEDIWGHFHRIATTTARPNIHARPIETPPTFNNLPKPQPFLTQPDTPEQFNSGRREPLFNPPIYNPLGQKGIPDTRDASANVQPLAKADTLFNVAGLEKIMQQRGRTEVKPVWAAPVIEQPNIKFNSGLRTTTVSITNVEKTTPWQPVKDLRASQHDIRSYKLQPYHFYNPSINIAQDNELDLFLKSSLTRSSGNDIQASGKISQPQRYTKPVLKRDSKPNQYTKPNQYHKPLQHITTTSFPTAAKPHSREPVAIYRHDDRGSPLSFEELLLRQLRKDSSLFDTSRWDRRHSGSAPKADSKIDINITVPSGDSAVVSEPTLDTHTTASTILPLTTTQEGTTPEPVADEHPPPIFDSKVFKTFMPFPKDQPTTKEPGNNRTKDLIGTSELRPFDDTTTDIDHGTCKGCTFVNDRCLLPDPVHCNRYIECVKQGPAVRVFTRECALGSFFDRQSFLCVEPKNANCPTDRCREPGLKAYIIYGHCKHYWVCGARKDGGTFAQAECCPEGGGFKEGEGCIEMSNCTESCDFSKSEELIIGCKLRKTASPAEYFDENANIVRPCAPGTVFSEPKCTCIQDVTVERSESPTEGPTCECRHGIPVLSGDVCSCREPTTLEKLKAEAKPCPPILNMTFDGGKIQDLSTQRQHVGIENIAASDKGQLTTTAKGRVILWRYSNLVFADIFSVRLRFKPTKKGPRYQTLLSNCDPDSGSEPSIEISIDTIYHEVIFSVNTYMSPLKQIKIYYQTDKWSTVYLIYDGERIVGAVDGRVRNIYSGGGIETRPHPIGIGSCGTKVGLHGMIDDVVSFEDCISDDMYDVFMNVLE